MKTAILIVGHSQKEEWKINASYFSKMSNDSIIKNSDILAYVNCKDIKASTIESYLDLFPNKNKYLLYTPSNGHSIETLPLDVKSNSYKIDYNKNRTGYLFGVLEAYCNTFQIGRAHV